MPEPVAPGTNPFEHPDAMRCFRVMSNVEELALALDYPWERWAVFLHPEQRKMIEKDFNGPARVSGTAVVRQNREQPVRTLSTMHWGLIPYWSKDTRGAARMINARAETIAKLPAYRDSFAQRRCLVAADGFYEWKQDGKARQLFNFGMKDDSIFGLAGIWDRWNNPAGEMIESCSILTTSPNGLLADIHDRYAGDYAAGNARSLARSELQKHGRAFEFAESVRAFDDEALCCQPASELGKER